MDPKPCPVPELADVFAPYVRSREEVRDIRQRLQAHLEATLSSDKTFRLTSANLHNPGITLAEDFEIPETITGVRRSYIEALKAHSAAQARYDALKAKLAQVSQEKRTEKAEDSIPKFKDSLLPILREREKDRRLQIVQQAYNEIEALSEDLFLPLDEILRRDVGEQPVMPELKPIDEGNYAALEEGMTRLKKAILLAKRPHIASPPKLPSAKVRAIKTPEIYGLECALNELTLWMEQELTALAQANAANAQLDVEIASQPDTITDPSDQTTPRPSDSSDDSTTPAMARIKDRYEEYLSTLESLIYHLRNPPETNTDAIRAEMRSLMTRAPRGPSSTLSLSISAPPASAAESQPSPSEILLPHLPRLLVSKTLRDSMRQQSEYISRQASLAESASARLTAQLASESRLVPDGAQDGQAWARASAEADRDLQTYVQERLEASRMAAQDARRILNEMREMRELLEEK